MPGSLTIRFLALPAAFLFAAVSTGTGLNAIIGIYLAGINADTVISAARHFSVLNESFRQTPVFLQSGENDEVATPADHRSIRDQLKRAGFKELRIEYGAGSHEVDPPSLRTALDWFRKVAPPVQH
jgi:predicted esterase